VLSMFGIVLVDRCSDRSVGATTVIESLTQSSYSSSILDQVSLLNAVGWTFSMNQAFLFTLPRNDGSALDEPMRVS
jgi:hypothetical protein